MPAPTPESPKVLITTVPFGQVDPRPVQLLERYAVDFTINPLGRRLTEGELGHMIEPYSILIAGTEPITPAVLRCAPRLRLIARVGVGLDSVALDFARQQGIQVTYTPDAPAPAVAELTVGLMLSLLRGINQADRRVRAGQWERIMGRRLSGLTVGIIGMGRVGKRVVGHLSSFQVNILANDLVPDREFGQQYNINWVDKNTIYAMADIVTLHVPLTPATLGMISARELSLFKSDALLVNTARGALIEEAALAEALRAGRLGGAAIDVHVREPYSGELSSLDGCILTCHMGSMSADCRARMEFEATEEVIRFLTGDAVRNPVPSYEYDTALAQSVRG